MLRFPPEFQEVISIFSSSFRNAVWQKAQVLLLGAICCPGSRTICNVLRVVGLSQEKRFDKYHRVLSRDCWSALSLSRILLQTMVRAFVGPGEALVFGIDETVERRWGAKIKKRGIYRDPVRSSASHFVKCSGLRWMVLMLLTPLPWLKNSSWALPFLSAICPSMRYYQNRDKPRAHKTLMDWARQLISWLSRHTQGLEHPVYLVGDGTYATYELMIHSAKMSIGLIARMRMDARLFHFPPPQPKGKRGRKPQTGKRMMSMSKRLHDKRIAWRKVSFSQWYGKKNKEMLITSGVSIWDSNKGYRVKVKWVLIKDPQGQLEPVLLACSDLNIGDIDMVHFFVRRWRVEVTFAEVRRHLGVETQRQWSDLAIERTTPVLMGLKSIICLMAQVLWSTGLIRVQTTAWYKKKDVTFSDIITAVRLHIWRYNQFPTSHKNSKVGNLIPTIRYLWHTLTLAAA